MNHDFPQAPQSLPGDMPVLLRKLADAWAREPSRPHPKPEVLAHWDELIAEWSGDSSLPLFVRKAANYRGSVVRLASGREVVPTDNSPAQWAFALAVLGECPSLDWVRSQVASDAIPVAMILNKSERAAARYRCTLKRAVNPNSAGWKVAHIAGVGLASGDPIEAISEARLGQHFSRLMSPRNMFVIHTEYAGLGELPEFCDEIRKSTISPG